MVIDLTIKRNNPLYVNIQFMYKGNDLLLPHNLNINLLNKIKNNLAEMIRNTNDAGVVITGRVHVQIHSMLYNMIKNSFDYVTYINKTQEGKWEIG